jgi:hypothetical protein
MKSCFVYVPLSLLLLDSGILCSQSSHALREGAASSEHEMKRLATRAKIEHSLKITSLHDAFDGAALSASNKIDRTREQAN